MVIFNRNLMADHIMKLLRMQSDLSIIKRALVLSLGYFILFNTSVLLYKYSYYKAGESLALAELCKESLYVCLMLFLSFLGFSINNILFKIYSLFLYLTGAFVSYYIYAMNILPTKHMVKAFFDVESVEAYELVSIKMIAWVVICLAVCIYLLRRFDAKETSNSLSKALLYLFFIASIANVITPFYRVFNSYLPIEYLHNSYHYFLERFSSHKRTDITMEHNFTEKAPDDLIAVLVIGESARYDHFSLNGYPRQTNPRLRTEDNLHSYKCTATSNMTYLSVSSMLSGLPAESAEDAMHQTSLLSVFTNLGFNTIWIATQSLTKYFRHLPSSIYDEVNLSIIPGGSALYALSSYDEVMLPYFESAIENKGKSLIVLHTTGSHWNYTARYPKRFAQFTPGCEELSGKYDHSVCGHERLINSYDNSILYTDHFLSEVIKRLKDKNAFLIYVSDHGESLGENGFYGHGSGGIHEAQKNVPFISWFSNGYMKNNPKLKNIAYGKELSHDNIFHSMLDCASVSSKMVDKGLSICGL